jgi:hypothetical protein
MECAEGSAVMIELQPFLKGLPPFGVGWVGTPVGPLVFEPAMEPLDLAVGPGPIGAGPLEPDAVIGGGLHKPLGVGVSLGVVGQHPLDGDPRLANKPAAWTRNRAEVAPVWSSRSWREATWERSSSSEWTQS